jgi:sulfur carrier protein
MVRSPGRQRKGTRDDGRYPHGKIVLALLGVPKVIQLSVNGQNTQVASNFNVAHLLESMALAGKRVAVEKNGEIVPRSRYSETVLAEGDRLEIVVAVGGG